MFALPLFLGNETAFSFLLQGFDLFPTVPIFLLRLILTYSPFHLSVQQSERRESPLSCLTHLVNLKSIFLE